MILQLFQLTAGIPGMCYLQVFVYCLRLEVFWIVTLQSIEQLDSTLATSELHRLTHTH